MKILAQQLVEMAPTISGKPRAAHTLRTSILSDVEDRLNRDGKNYGAVFSVEIGSMGIQVRAWIDGPKEEASEVAKMFLGKEFTLGPHKLVDGKFVAKRTYSLRELM